MCPARKRFLIRGWALAVGVALWIFGQAFYHNWWQEEILSVTSSSGRRMPKDIPTQETGIYWGIHYLRDVRSIKPSSFQDPVDRAITVGFLYTFTENFDVKMNTEFGTDAFIFRPLPTGDLESDPVDYAFELDEKRTKVRFSGTGEVLPWNNRFVYLVLTDPTYSKMEFRRYPEGTYPEEWPKQVREYLPAPPSVRN